MPNIFTNNGYIVSIVKDPHGNVTDEEDAEATDAVYTLYNLYA